MSSIRITLAGLTVLMLMTHAQAQPASQPAKAQPVDYQKLKTVLPDTAVGIRRSTHEGENISIGEMSMSRANAEYAKADASDKDPRITMEIMDYGASPQMVAGLTAWRMVPIKIENDQGYQRTVKFKDFPAFQTYTKDGESRQMIVLVADRFLVTLSTNNVNEADFARAADAMAWDKLAAMK